MALTHLLAASILTAAVTASTSSPPPEFHDLAAQGDTASINHIRARGPEGLARFITANETEITAARAALERGESPTSEHRALLKALDRIAAQKDAA
ncbi:MAG: hypothetical protein VYC34_10595, partial [Planctomycetota bacterium]|nr:hypothetical protein [Planctomycetota bacterium]